MNRVRIQPVDEILQEIDDNVGAAGNVFPADIIEVQFLAFKLPTGQNAEIRESFRLENISDKPINMRVWAYYDRALRDYIIAFYGDITGESMGEPLPVIKVEPKKGYRVGSSTGLLFEYSKYSEKEMQKIKELLAILSIRVEIDGKNYYFKLDMANSKVVA